MKISPEIISDNRTRGCWMRNINANSALCSSLHRSLCWTFSLKLANFLGSGITKFFLATKVGHKWDSTPETWLCALTGLSLRMGGSPKQLWWICTYGTSQDCCKVCFVYSQFVVTKTYLFITLLKSIIIGPPLSQDWKFLCRYHLGWF